MSTATGIQTAGQSSLMQLPTESGVVLNGSYIVFSCVNGYTNMGGSLNVTCGTTGSWSQFPNCVSSTGSGSITTTTMSAGSGSITTTAVSAGTGLPCVVDKTTIYNITNGYPSSISLSYISDTAATGN